MRKILLSRNVDSCKYTGTFIRCGYANNYGAKIKTVLIKNIRDEKDELVTDHQWFRFYQGFESLDLQSGYVVGFEANVSAYMKGYLGKKKELKKIKRKEMDYQLTNLNNVSIVSREVSGDKEEGNLCEIIL